MEKTKAFKVGDVKILPDMETTATGRQRCGVVGEQVASLGSACELRKRGVKKEKEALLVPQLWFSFYLINTRF